MKDLLQALFERDLSVEEFARLRREVERSPHEAERLAGLARRAYRNTGLPDPMRSRSKLRLGMILALAAAGLAWLSWPRRPAAPVLALVQPAPKPASRAQPGSPLPPPFRPAPKEAPVLELALQQGSDELRHVQAVLRCRREEGLKLWVEDMEGRPVLPLLDGPLGPGTWVFTWDLRGTDGALVKPGVYYVRLEHSQGMERRAVEIESVKVSGQPRRNDD